MDKAESAATVLGALEAADEALMDGTSEVSQERLSTPAVNYMGFVK